MAIQDLIASVPSKLGLKSSAPPVAPYHPLDPINEQEITACVAAVRQHLPTHRLWFKSTQLVEPPKAILAPWLDAVAEGQTPEKLPRIAEVLVGERKETSGSWYVCKLELAPGGGAKLLSCDLTPNDQHVPADMLEMVAAEKSLLADPEFQEAIRKLDLPSNAKIIADGWIYGADSLTRVDRYISFMVYLAFSENPDECHYAAPLPIIPVLDADTFKLARIDYCPIYGTGGKTLLDLETRFPWEHYQPNEYDAAIRDAAGLSARPDVKPYRVIQPEGASFTLEGRVIKWQKWSLHIGFNYREGVVLSDIRYDGRKTFYRLSVSDMTVPYGDPRAPYHRKQAFDLGDVGAGLTANELALGCDCLGEIAYLDFDHLDATGGTTKAKGVVCIHEQDDGIGWKHTNYRTNRPAVTRARVLIIQTIITVANYEYIFAWKFDQAAGVHLETRATGILSTAAILPGETSPYGNVVSPGVLATNHQHLFSVRIDPAIDGHNNTVVQEDSVPMPFDKSNPSAENRYGVGYVVEKTPITTSGFADAAPEKNRVFKIVNPNKTNPISGRPIGYKLVPTPSQLMLAHPDSVGFARAEFGDHHIYVTSYKDGELYSGGQYTNQSNGGANGIRSWYGRKDNVENTDLVLWHTFGLTHNPRVEDFPVMPCETHMISLKPADFFTASPAIDVPMSNQAFNASKLHTSSPSTGGPGTAAATTNGHGGAHMQGSAEVERNRINGHANGNANANGKSCCK